MRCRGWVRNEGVCSRADVILRSIVDEDVTERYNP